MKPSLKNWRYTVLFGGLFVALGALTMRMGLLVKEGQAKALEVVEIQERMVSPIPARPGNISGKTIHSSVPLAMSKQAPSCYADPQMFKDDNVGDLAVKLGRILEMDAREIQDKIISRRDTSSRFVWLKRDITEEQAQQIKALKQRSLGLLYEWRREYPNGQLAASVVGFRRNDGVPGHGIELSQQKYLAAEDGLRVVLADAQRRAIWPVPEDSRPPKDGSSVQLTIDLMIQDFLEKAVAEAYDKFRGPHTWATGVVMDPRTGDILGMCSVPTFNPNEYNRARPEDFTNKAVTMSYEPGSAFKPLVAAAGVNLGLMTWQTKFDCEGGVYSAPNGGTISDHGSHYGVLTLEDIIVFSSNIGMAKVGEKMGNKNIHDAVRAYGFGRDVNVGLPGESGGIIRALRSWDGYSMRRVPFGQEISVTALQLARAYCVIANDGRMVKPRLIEKVTDENGKVILENKVSTGDRVLSSACVKGTLQAMEQVVERGTGKACRSTHWSIGGKTGTAQIPVNGVYPEGAFTGTFVAVAPANNPRLVVLISVYWPDRAKGHFGATVAAPYVKKVMENSLGYLGVRPDLNGTERAGDDGRNPHD